MVSWIRNCMLDKENIIHRTLYAKLCDKLKSVFVQLLKTEVLNFAVQVSSTLSKLLEIHN